MPGFFKIHTETIRECSERKVFTLLQTTYGDPSIGQDLDELQFSAAPEVWMGKMTTTIDSHWKTSSSSGHWCIFLTPPLVKVRVGVRVGSKAMRRTMKKFSFRLALASSNWALTIMKREWSETRRIWTETLTALWIKIHKEHTFFFPTWTKHIYLFTWWLSDPPGDPWAPWEHLSSVLTLLPLDPAQSLMFGRASKALVESMQPLFKIGKIKMSESTKWNATQ